MAKKQVPAERTKNPNNSDNHTKTNNLTTAKPKPKPKPKTKNKNRTIEEASSEEAGGAIAAPSSSVETQNDDAAESEERADEGNSTDEEEKEKRKSIKKEDVKKKGKKRSKREKDDDEAEEEKSESALYTFPMNRVSRIIKSEVTDAKISQEAVFLINRASEKFLQLFCREAYACAFLDNKKSTDYNHLSSVVSKRRRFGFLSDFVPEKVKAGDALAQIPEAEN